MKKKIVKIPIFFGSLIMIIVDDWNEVGKRYGVDLSDCYEAAVFNAHDPDGYTRYCVGFKGKPTNKIIAHEVTHLVNNLMIDRGIKSDPNNDETQAYLSGWFFSEIEKFINGKYFKE